MRRVEETLTPETKIAEVARRHDVHPNLLSLRRGWAQRKTRFGRPQFLPSRRVNLSR